MPAARDRSVAKRSSTSLALLLLLLSGCASGDRQPREPTATPRRAASDGEKALAESRRPTGGPEQRAAVPSEVWSEPCEDELARLCDGERSAQGCLRSHLGELSLDCRSALLGPPPPPARGSAGAHRRRIMDVCGDDVDALCSGSGGRRETIACLASQRDSLEPRCRAAVDAGERPEGDLDEGERPRGKGPTTPAARRKVGGVGRGGTGGMGRGF